MKQAVAITKTKDKTKIKTGIRFKKCKCGIQHTGYYIEKCAVCMVLDRVHETLHKKLN